MIVLSNIKIPPKLTAVIDPNPPLLLFFAGGRADTESGFAVRLNPGESGRSGSGGRETAQIQLATIRVETQDNQLIKGPIVYHC